MTTFKLFENKKWRNKKNKPLKTYRKQRNKLW